LIRKWLHFLALITILVKNKWKNFFHPKLRLSMFLRCSYFSGDFSLDVLIKGVLIKKRCISHPRCCRLGEKSLYFPVLLFISTTRIIKRRLFICYHLSYEYQGCQNAKRKWLSIFFFQIRVVFIFTRYDLHFVRYCIGRTRKTKDTSLSLPSCKMVDKIKMTKEQIAISSSFFT